jgi:hypothetical protein
MKNAVLTGMYFRVWILIAIPVPAESRDRTRHLDLTLTSREESADLILMCRDGRPAISKISLRYRQLQQSSLSSDRGHLAMFLALKVSDHLL